MHLTRMRLGGVPAFTEPVEFAFDERVNVFVGPNASGKSTALLMLADKLIGAEENSKRPISQGRGYLRLAECANDEFDEWVEEEPRIGWRSNVIALSEDWIGTKEEYRRADVEPAVVDIAAVREDLPGVSEMKDSLVCDETASQILAGQFSGISVVSVIEAFSKELWVENDEAATKARGNAMRAVEFADACSKTICGELIRDSKSHNYIPGPDIRGYLNHPHANPNRIAILRQSAINTNDIRNFENLSIWERPSDSAYSESPDALPLYLGHLSSGTEGTLLWIRWLAFKMLHHYEFAEDWHERPAILFIDEIENHLHPTWQRRVIPALLEHFPGLQIFATTHSPFVVAGLKAGQVHMLQRDANGMVTTSTNERDIIGWTTDEILRTFMGVDEPTDQLTIDRANRLRELRGKETLNDAERDEMEELRRQVNEDFLSSSTPLEAQRERYGDMMLEFLRSRQSELSQDGA